MIELCEARRFVRELPWPEDAPRPVVRMWGTPQGCVVLLHENVSRGWSDVARIHGPTMEGALRFALERWLQEKGLNNQPALYAALKRLSN
jgi:hypothetical protein